MPSVVITASGMVTAVGFDSRATCAAIRAGVSGVRVDNLWDAAAGTRMRMARPRTPHWWEGPDMLAELSAPAVAECLAALPREIDPTGVPILVLLSASDRPGREPDLDRIVLDGLEHRLGFPLPPESSAFNEGRTGLLSACVKTERLLAAHAASHVVVLGVDTFLRQRVVDAYMDRRRVLTADNSNGFIPGEAACAVLLSTPSHDRRPELRIVSWASGRESGTIESEEPLTGDGLTAALRTALTQAKLRIADTHYWLCDQNAEHYKAKECTLAQIRLERRDRPAPQPYQIWHPIEFLGEIGSAIGPCLFGLALAAAADGYAPGPLALMHVSEDGGTRAAFVLRWQADS